MIRFPAEWEPQEFVQLTWPHADTDWKDYLEEAHTCFTEIAHAIARFQKVLVVCPDTEICSAQLAAIDPDKVTIIELESDDTWARDHGGITVFQEDKPLLYDFRFNGWGDKFSAGKDNRITRHLFERKVFTQAMYQDRNDFVFEGGGIESNGKGILLTTSACLLSKNRNEQFSQKEIEGRLLSWFGAQKVLWLDSGYLAGDDTDSHIDTLARFTREDTVMYVAPPNEADEHYTALKRMEEQLKTFTNLEGEPFQLIALPFPPAVYDENGDRLPATYANFLLINGAVLVPVYQLDTDAEALEVFARAFPEREVVAIDCSVLIKQHGSLHCVTMQYPKGV